MELKPEKLKEIFPEIRGNIETFGSKSVFKIGILLLSMISLKDILLLIMTKIKIQLWMIAL